jgi:hypothetical protein
MPSSRGDWAVKIIDIETEATNVEVKLTDEGKRLYEFHLDIKLQNA